MVTCVSQQRFNSCCDGNNRFKIQSSFTVDLAAIVKVSQQYSNMGCTGNSKTNGYSELCSDIRRMHLKNKKKVLKAFVKAMLFIVKLSFMNILL